jgi:Asparagine synthase
MLSGRINLSAPAINVDTLQAAHPLYVEIATAETENSYICIALEKAATTPPLAAKLWGQGLSLPQYAALMQEAQEWPLQSIIITQSKNDGHVEIVRNRHATCGLYLAAKDNILHLNWDPVRLYGLVDAKNPINMEVAIASINMHSRYRAETVFRNIYGLPERGKAIVRNNQISIIPPPHIDPPQAIALKEAADPVALFHDLIRDSINRWPIEPEQTGTILSSGLDTTIVAHMLQEKTAQQMLHSFGFWMMHEKRDEIQAMRMETVKRLRLLDFYPRVEENIHMGLSSSLGSYWPEQSATDFADLQLARRMQTQGITLVTTGIGGDELCILNAHERVARNLSPEAESQWEGDPHENFSVLTDMAIANAPEIDAFAWPNGYMGISVPSMASSLSLFYLRHGVWMINPLAATEIQLFAQFLPAEWRRNRRLSREALTRLGYSENFTQQIPKEDLSLTMETLMLRTDWSSIFHTAAVCDLGLVDRTKLFKGVDIFEKTRSVAVGIKLMQVLQLELGIRSALNS